MSVIKTLDKFADWCEKNRPDIVTAEVDCLPATLRKAIKKKTGFLPPEGLEITYRGLSIRFKKRIRQ